MNVVRTYYYLITIRNTFTYCVTLNRIFERSFIQIVTTLELFECGDCEGFYLVGNCLHKAACHIADK